MEYRQLGRTDIRVSRVAMGCWQIVGSKIWGKQDEADSTAAVNTALELGVNLFDTAQGYGSGESEAMLGRALGSRRDQAIIATKVSPSNLEPDKLVAACEASLERLGTDYIDLYQIHWPNWEVPLDDTLGAMKRLQEQGKIHLIGVSNFGPQDLSAALEHADIVSDQLAYSLLARMIEYEIQPLCVERGVSILPYSPLMQGLLTGKYRSPDEVPDGRARSRHFSDDRPQARHGQEGCEQETFQAIERVQQIAKGLGKPMGAVALAWCLHQPAVASVIAGARNADHVRDNVAAAEVELDQPTLEALDEATRPVKEKLGPSADMWAAEPRLR